jgi:hypothetical protein
MVPRRKDTDGKDLFYRGASSTQSYNNFKFQKFSSSVESVHKSVQQCLGLMNKPRLINLIECDHEVCNHGPFFLSIVYDPTRRLGQYSRIL